MRRPHMSVPRHREVPSGLMEIDGIKFKVDEEDSCCADNLSLATRLDVISRGEAATADKRTP